MTQFEYMQQHTQLTIDDILSAIPNVSTAQHIVGDKVKIHYYADELEYVCSCFPQYLEHGQIVEVCNGYCRVAIAGEVITVDSEKLMKGVR